MELNACLADAEEHMNGEAEYEVSNSEIHHFERMVEDLVDWLHDMCLLDDDGNLDRDELKKLTDAMRHGVEYDEDEDEGEW